MAPKCKRCGARCQKYGGIGGYSVQCKSCNERSGILRRASYARNKWRLPMGQLHALRTHAHEQALLNEPTQQFPGVDIDAIHYKRRAA
jgi:hypothetical protein